MSDEAFADLDEARLGVLSRLQCECGRLGGEHTTDELRRHLNDEPFIIGRQPLYEVCDQCNYDSHCCHFCGDSLSHARAILGNHSCYIHARDEGS